MFDKECVGSWVGPTRPPEGKETFAKNVQVEYFKKRRVMEHNRDAMLKKLDMEGAKPIPVPNPVGQAQKEP